MASEIPEQQHLTLGSLVNLGSLQIMANSHYKATGMPIGIIDSFDNSVLVGAGWQDICTEFHRANPQTLARCYESELGRGQILTYIFQRVRLIMFQNQRKMRIL